MTETKDNGKTIAILAYITLIGWIIALIMHNSNKTKLGAFHIRQSLGIMILGILLSFITGYIDVSIISMAANISIIVLWVIGLLGAIQGENKLVPVVGEKIQETLKGIG